MRIILIADKELKEELVPANSGVGSTMTWVDEPEALKDTREGDACIDLLFDGTEGRYAALKELHASILIVNSVIKPGGVMERDLVRMNGWNSFLKREIIEAAGPRELQQKAEQVFSSINKRLEWTPDIDGLITPRIIASIINEAYFALQENVSSKEEIDTAMKLGTNYPFGPFEWGRKIGLRRVCKLLQALALKDNRYAPAALLIKEADL